MASLRRLDRQLLRWVRYNAKTYRPGAVFPPGAERARLAWHAEWRRQHPRTGTGSSATGGTAPYPTEVRRG